MTLAQLATFVCTKVRQNNTAALAIAKEFLQRRHEMLWHEALWKDSLVQYTQTLSPDGYTVTSTWLPTKGVLLCPPVIDRVLAARIADRKLNVQRPEYYFRIDYDSFAKQGNATEFVLLPPCVWEFETAQAVRLTADLLADNGTALTADVLAADGISVERSSITMANMDTAVATTERVDAITKAATTGNITLALAGLVVSGAGSALANGLLDTLTTTGEYRNSAVYLTVSGGGGALYDADSDSQLYSSTNLIGQWDTINNGSSPAPTVAWNSIVTVPAAALGADKRQRLRLLEIPTEEVTIRVLGKRVCPTFSADNDAPAISGVTNCLLAFAQADLLQWLRQYGKAQAAQQEGVALLDQLKELEMVQQAHNITIQPSDAFVSEWQFNSGAYSPLTF